MFKKVLIANRGEIALRVIRACRELGVRTVAVYSDADATAPHVRAADEAVHLGPAVAAESYLHIERLIDAAKRTGAQAVHPGYGFLSERAPFARAVRDAGLVFIGPPAEAIEAVGSKTAARAIATQANVPIVPGTAQPLVNADEAITLAKQFGYPILLKAASGGGGKGMRVVRSANELSGALDAARREALKAFGDDAVYMEKFLEGPRHVEIQVLGDQHGTMLSLGERECSVQRRHQKVIEEAPSVAVNSELRQRMGEAAVRVAQTAGYVNAGTCEFLLDSQGQFYFLEMNTRIQVEHPVTECVTGIDLVAWQLRIAAGEPLPWQQANISAPRGWAIECRITAEDVDGGFLPSTGRVTFLRVPSGPGVRWDGGIETGSEVGLFYDSLLAKLIVYADTREIAIARMRSALDTLVVEGVQTTRQLHARILDDSEFQRGAIDIHWLERRLTALMEAPRPEAQTLAAAVAGALLVARGGKSVASPSAPSASNEPGANLPTNSAWLDAARREALR